MVNVIKAIDTLYSKNQLGIKKTPVVLMAGGFGKRLAPITNFLPKALMPLNNKPILEHIIHSFLTTSLIIFFYV